MEDQWKDERMWIEVMDRKLYPPEAIAKRAGAKDLIKGEDFRGYDVLDHGCGTGWLGEIAKKRGARVVGADISKTLIAEAGKRIDAVQVNGYRLPFKDNSFDYMFSFTVLQVVPQAGRMLSEYARVLRPNGPLAFAIVHPHSEVWAGDRCYREEYDGYRAIEERDWVFNLTDGRQFSKTYIHRPLEWYVDKLSRDFYIERLIEPELPAEFERQMDDGIYARREYLMGIAIRKP